ncbi:MAG: biopolymer transporter ExbD [Gammaproteobacteria bacterium]|nr:biopolymer transporter ExbD [Gammaproteobacteria bacterium]
MRRYILARSHEESTIDLTPMLDVVFIMLIFFIVTATFVTEVGLDLNTPNNDAPITVSSDSGLLVSLSASNRISIDGRHIDIRRVGALVRARHAESALSGVVVEAQEGASTGVYIALQDEINNAVHGLPVALSLSSPE